MLEDRYSTSEKLLHRMALGSNAIADVSFDIEQALYGKSLQDVPGDHVFIAGLARAGTTLLLRLLYQTGAFCSLTYRDMPFVLAPNLWAKLSQRSAKAARPRERAHGDGLQVDFDSPEAFEEVFWRVNCARQFIFDDHLGVMRAPDEVVAKFRRYVNLILLKNRRTRYLSKNNNNVLRLQTITRAFPAATILIPFRSPRAQAESLLNQHRRFVSMHEENPFSRNYMRWLVHYEFGSDHRPFEWGLSAGEIFSPGSVEYWMQQWIGTYNYLLKFATNTPARLLFIGYDALCAEPGKTWERLSRKIGIPETMPDGLAVRPPSENDRPPCDERLLSIAEELFHSLDDAVL